MNRESKPKKTAKDLVEMLKNEKGVLFNIVSEEEAVNYIKNVNNFLRTASYRKNYDKHEKGANKGKYIDLEFAYLMELSTIDMRLRTCLFRMCIDIEHAIKTKLLTAIEDNPFEDGYNIVDKYFEIYNDAESKIEQKADTVFTGPLIEKYFSLCYVFSNETNEKGVHKINIKMLKNDCPVWVLVELLSFGEVIKLIGLYNDIYPKYSVPIPSKNILEPIKSLRNACAHNNCLLNNMHTGTTKPNQEISTYIASIDKIGIEERKNKLSCRPFFEIVCLIKAYTETVSERVKTHGIKELKNIVNKRMFEHIDYFEKNSLVKTSFDFLKKTLDNL